MEYRRLNLTLLSAEGIKTLKNLFAKMDAYVDVSLVGYPLSRHTTPVDHNCGGRPSWNSAMEFVVDEPNLTKPGLSLQFEIRAENALGNDKVVGTVTVPIHELYQAVASNPSVDTPAEYQIITTSGKPKGIIKISYRFGEKFIKDRGDDAAATAVTAYPPPAGPSGYGYEEKKKDKNKKKKKKKKKKKSGVEKLAHGLAQGVGFISGLVVGELIGVELAAEEAEEEEEDSGSSD